MQLTRVAAIVAGAIVVAGTTVGGAAALYYAYLPAHPGPDNASPPPEAFGLALGALLGCAAGVALVGIAQRSAPMALVSIGVVFGVGSICWLLFGSSDLIGRVFDVVVALVICVSGAAVGVIAVVAVDGLRGRYGSTA